MLIRGSTLTAITISLTTGRVTRLFDGLRRDTCSAAPSGGHTVYLIRRHPFG